MEFLRQRWCSPAFHIKVFNNTYTNFEGPLPHQFSLVSLYRAGSLKAAARELARYKLDVVGVQEVRWDKESTVRAGDYNFF